VGFRRIGGGGGGEGICEVVWGWVCGVGEGVESERMDTVWAVVRVVSCRRISPRDLLLIDCDLIECCPHIIAHNAIRYILQPPSECDKLELYERGHPSARHSRIDWSNMDEVFICCHAVTVRLCHMFTVLNYVRALCQTALQRTGKRGATRRSLILGFYCSVC
jgi:hypothetical protein